MAVLSDSIEQFIKSLMEGGMIELQRNELAEYFSCAPSQINYVLATRFSPEQGYVIESRRGGGGYIRVVRIDADRSEQIMAFVREKLAAGKISARDSHALISGLLEMGNIDKKQQRLLLAAISDKALCIPAMRDSIRASILKEMLLALLSEEE